MDKSRRRQLKLFQKKIRYRFRNQNLLNQCLTHKSFVHERPDLASADNERLEFLGDSVLGVVISDYLYGNFPDNEEGDLTKFKSMLVSAATLAKVARRLAIGDYLLLGKGEAACGGNRQSSNLVCASEALIAAIYLDRGIKPAAKFILACLREEIISVKEGKGEQDYKSLLQEFSLRCFKLIPEYKVLAARGPEHRKHFEVSVSVEGKAYGKGSGFSKKSAEQAAAKQALKELEGKA